MQKLLANGAFAKVYQVQIGKNVYAQKLFSDNIKERKKEEIINYFEQIFKEINLMSFISKLDCPYILQLRGVAVCLNPIGIFNLALYTDKMNSNLEEYTNSDSNLLEKSQFLQKNTEILL